MFLSVSCVTAHQHTNHHTHTIMDQVMAAMPRHADIVSESDILMEEIMSSTRNVDELFNADSPGKIGQPLAGARSRKRRQVRGRRRRVANNMKPTIALNLFGL